MGGWVGASRCYDCNWKIPPSIPSPLTSNYWPFRGFRTLAANQNPQGEEKKPLVWLVHWWKGQKEDKMKLLYLKIPTIISHSVFNVFNPPMKSFVLWIVDAIPHHLGCRSLIFIDLSLLGDILFLNQNDVKNSIYRQIRESYILWPDVCVYVCMCVPYWVHLYIRFSSDEEFSQGIEPSMDKLAPRGNLRNGIPQIQHCDLEASPSRFSNRSMMDGWLSFSSQQSDF